MSDEKGSDERNLEKKGSEEKGSDGNNSQAGESEQSGNPKETLEWVNSMRFEHISEKAKKIVPIKSPNLDKLADPSLHLSRHTIKGLVTALDHCIKCNTCKYAFKEFTPSCPSGEEFLWESYWASGRIRLARALLLDKMPVTQGVVHPIFSCITCGSCMDQCQASHRRQIVDIIEGIREFCVKSGVIPEKQAKIKTLVDEFSNPYGVSNKNANPFEQLRSEHGLPEQAEIVYYIGCTSNYRREELRDATISVLKKLGVNFTIIDEKCCGSPLIRTGQIDNINELIKNNIGGVIKSGAKTVITSCAGCYRTLSVDYDKFLNESGLEHLGKVFSEEFIDGYKKINIVHSTKFILDLLKKQKKRLKNDSGKLLVTYHDPCHLGHHMGFFEPPRDLLKLIPNLELIEMERNRTSAWCCGAGGGVKIGYPEFALSTAEKRIDEAETTGASVLSSACPFCKTNLSQANHDRLDVLDVIELIHRSL